MSHIKHVVVVGFHHKKGAIIEYSYPEISENELNTTYTLLPQLALPDGAHNFSEDLTYLFLTKNLYAVSYYRQVQVSELKVVSEEFTRNSVQKSVLVILEKNPDTNYLFGQLAKKLQVISKIYFEEKDFSKTEILQDLYTQLTSDPNNENNVEIETIQEASNSDLNSIDLKNVSISETDSPYFGISIRKSVQLLRHNILTLLKLILLEKRVIIYGNGSQKVGNVILSLLAILPKYLESNILTHNNDTEIELLDAISYDAKHGNSRTTSKESTGSEVGQPPKESQKTAPVTPHEFENTTSLRENSNEFDKPAPKRQFDLKDSLETVNHDEFGHPLAIFTHGNFVLPYTCLGQITKLENTEKSRTGFLIGTSNDLMRMKWKDFSDCFVSLSDGAMNIKSPVLAHQVQLTTADLRFVDKIVEKCGSSSAKKSVKAAKSATTPAETEASFTKLPSSETQNTLESLESNCTEPIEYEGGDEWIRNEFAHYINSFLAVSKFDYNPQLANDFNMDFLKAWKSNTVNSKFWYNLKISENSESNLFENIRPIHPCHFNQLDPNSVNSAAEALNFTSKILNQEVSDATLKLRYALKSTASGRKVEAAYQDLSAKTNQNIQKGLEYSNVKLTQTYEKLQNVDYEGLTENVANYTSTAAETAIIGASKTAELAGKTLGSAASQGKKWFTGVINTMNKNATGRQVNSGSDSQLREEGQYLNADQVEGENNNNSQPPKNDRDQEVPITNLEAIGQGLSGLSKNLSTGIGSFGSSFFGSK